MSRRERLVASAIPVSKSKTGVAYGEVSWERMIRAVEKVRERLRRAVATLEAANVPYAVAGGNAVAAWVSRVDEAAVRNTQTWTFFFADLIWLRQLAQCHRPDLFTAM